MTFFRILGRSIRDAFKSVSRNMALSLASISCIIVTLIIVGASIIVTYNVDNFSENLKQDLTIVAFVSNDADDLDIKKLRKNAIKSDKIADSSNFEPKPPGFWKNNVN